MKTSDRGLLALIRREALVLSTYKDSVGVLTIGVGHTAAAGAPKPVKGLTITAAEGMALFRKDVAKYERDVNAAVKEDVSQREFDALVSFHYNTGAIRRASLTKFLNARNRSAAALAFMKWVTPKEITGRRKEEQRQFMHGDYGDVSRVPVYAKWPGRAKYVSAVEILSRVSSAPLGLMSQDETPPELEERPVTKVTPPAPLPADVDEETVKEAQKVLKRLGYYHTKVDGLLGPLTLAAISQFQKQNQIQVTGQLDNGTLEKLADPDAASSEMVPERANATPETVREILPEAKQTWRAKIAAKFSALGAGLWAMVTGVGQYFEDAKSYIEPVQDYVSSVPAWAWLVGIAAISGGIWYATGSAEQGQVDAYKEGARQ